MLNEKLIKAILLGAARQALAGVSGSLIAAGYISEEHYNLLLVGLVGLAASYVWSAKQKYDVNNRLQVAASMRAGATPEEISAESKRRRQRRREGGYPLVSLALAGLLAVGAPLTLSGCGDESQADLSARVVRGVSAVPALVRAVAPDADPRVLAAVDDGVALFESFSRNPTASRWLLAVDAWNHAVKGRLLALNNQRLSSVVAVVDILLTQVVMPEAAPSKGWGGADRVSKSAPVATKFKERDVRALERLVRQ